MRWNHSKTIERDPSDTKTNATYDTDCAGKLPHMKAIAETILQYVLEFSFGVTARECDLILLAIIMMNISIV